MKLVITVVGKDQVGIIAKVSTVLAENDVNILDISQTILQDKFTMMMYVEMNEKKINITDLKKAFGSMEENMKLAIQIYAEEIFNSMHKI
ncbi:MAG: ACT domain-containing protein [Spirochaetales bacterium]|nr:ACT domain-containing protein [Spirochaetales bacterium]